MKQTGEIKMKIFQVIIIDGHDVMVKEGFYLDETKVHNHIMSINGATCTQRYNEDGEGENGHYIIKRPATNFFKASSCVVYVTPIDVI